MACWLAKHKFHPQLHRTIKLLLQTRLHDGPSWRFFPAGHRDRVLDLDEVGRCVWPQAYIYTWLVHASQFHVWYINQQKSICWLLFAVYVWDEYYSKVLCWLHVQCRDAAEITLCFGQHNNVLIRIRGLPVHHFLLSLHLKTMAVSADSKRAADTNGHRLSLQHAWVSKISHIET